MELNKIYNENCLATMSRMPDNFIDLTVTSPPYDNLRDYNGYDFDFNAIAKELYRVTKDGVVVVWIVSDQTKDGSETGTSFKQALFFIEIGFNLHDTMIYHKESVPFSHNRYEQHFEYMFVLSKGKPKTFNPILILKKHFEQYRIKSYGRNANGSFDKGFQSNKVKKIIGNVWKYDIGGGKSSKDKIAYKHPAIFPEKLCADHIKSWSNEGDLIYDCFGGSGTTAKMSHLLKRNWILSEIDIKYVELANKRIEKYLTQQNLF